MTSGPGRAAAGAELSALLDRVPSLAGQPRAVTELAGGLTNRNYQVTTPAGRFVAQSWTSWASSTGLARTSRNWTPAGQVLLGPSADRPTKRPAASNAVR